jgi:hypothetical protein
MVVEPTTNRHWGLKCTRHVEAGVGGVAARTRGGSEKSTYQVDLRRRPRRLRVGSAVCHESGGRGGERGRARKLRCRSRGSRSLEGWDGVGRMDGWITRAPANSFYNPNSASAAGEDFVGVSPILASSLQGAPQASERQGRREGAAAAPPRWARPPSSSFFR